MTMLDPAIDALAFISILIFRHKKETMVQFQTKCSFAGQLVRN